MDACRCEGFGGEGRERRSGGGPALDVPDRMEVSESKSAWETAEFEYRRQYESGRLRFKEHMVHMVLVK